MKKIILLSIMFLAFVSAHSQTKIPADSLPSKVKENIHKKFHGYSVANIVKVNDNGKVTYKLETRKEKGGNGTTTVYINYMTYDLNGKLLSKTKDKEIYYTDSPKPKPTQSNDGHNHQH